MIFGFTGTQEGMSEQQKRLFRAIIAGGMLTGWVELHHGDCTGADADAHIIALEMNVNTIVIHPPINEKKRAFCEQADDSVSIVIVRPPGEYLERNVDIVDECQELIAAPSSMIEKRRSGTWATVRYARKIGRPLMLLER